MTDIKRFTRAEVAANTGHNGTPLWTIIRDSVYELGNYANEHPGGVETITDYGGKDGTRDFDLVGHSADARVVLAKYKIGEIVEEEKRYDENGKKKKKVKAVRPEGSSRSCLSIITCGLAG